MDISQWIERNAGFAPRSTALRFEGLDTNYADFAREIERTAAVLCGLGLRQGDVVAYLGLNRPEVLALLFACARLGAILLPLNWRLAPPEHVRALADCKPRLLIAEPAFVEPLRTVESSLKNVQCISLGEAPEGWLAWGQCRPAPVLPAKRGGYDSPLLLCYTSGSTGTPKGVVLTQDALAWNAVNSTHMHDLTSADRVLTTLPLFHVGGLNIQTLPALHAGASVTLHARFDPATTLDAIERERITLAVLVPAQLVALMEHPRWTGADLSSLRMITTGSTIVSGAFVRQVSARGVPVIQVYGSTETCPIATYVRREDAERKAGSAGLAALHCEVKVVDDDGKIRDADLDGEILVRGPNVMQGYWNAPQQTAEVLTDGWYHTGDIGHFDREGHLYVASRKKDMIVSGGENIYPAELEAVLLECPAILDVCIVGRTHERWGEVPVAAVVLQPGASLTAAKVLKLFDGRIARYKHPHDVRFMQELPRTALGKLKKDDIRAEVERPDTQT